MTTTSASLLDRLKSWPLLILPHQLLSRLVRSATRWQSAWWKNTIIRLFIRHFNVDMSEAESPGAEGYPDFNSFFTRALTAGARPIDNNPQAILSPVDGCVSEAGDITSGRLIQAKGRDYSLSTLLGGDENRALPFQGGKFVTLYLSPRDYHRIHMPCSGHLLETTYVPGRLFSVAPHTVRVIPNLFTRNERLVTLFDTDDGPFAMILVGAIFVSCIETVWGGIANPDMGMALQTTGFDTGKPVELQAGDEMGRFNMGSTVILLYGPDRIKWADTLRNGQPVRMGETIGQRMH
jgi:phosphatidylserine decarboxylase